MTVDNEHHGLPTEPISKESVSEDAVERRARQVHHKLMQVLKSPHKNGEWTDVLTRLREADPAYLATDAEDASFDAFRKTWIRLKPARQGTVEEKINRACNFMRSQAVRGLTTVRH